MRFKGSKNFEKIWYIEFGVNTKYVLGLALATQIGLENDKKNLRTMTTNPLTPLPV